MPPPLIYFASDELPQWVATLTDNGAKRDFSTGWTFEVKLVDSTGTVALTKTTNITGAAAGVITVAWASGDLALTPGSYTAQLKASRTSDSAEETIAESLSIKARS